MVENTDRENLGKKLQDLCNSPNPDLDEAKRLLQEGAPVDYNVSGLETPLLYAVSHGYEDLVELLLRSKADVDYKMEGFGWSPLLSAVKSNHENIVHLLLKYGANPQIKKLNGATPFIVAAIVGNVKLLQTFLDLEVDINEADSFGFTAFMEAAQYGKEEALRFLFKNKAEVNKHREVSEETKTLGKGGKTALIDAVRKGHEDIVVILLDEMEAEVDAQDNLGRTPLMYALEEDNETIVTILLDRDADVSHVDKNYGTPIYTALKKDTVNTSLVKLLMEHRPDLNVCEEAESTPLILAVKKKKKDLVKLFLKDENINVNAKNNKGETALLAAVEVDDLAMAKLLCDKGADVNCINKSGDTPASVARRKYNLDMQTLLRKYEDLRGNKDVSPKRWKVRSQRWHEQLKLLRNVHPLPIGKLNLSRLEAYRMKEFVYLGFLNEETEVAVKCFRKDSEEARREMCVLLHQQIVSHSQFVRYIHHETDSQCEYICLQIYEYNLQELVEQNPEEIKEKAPNVMKELIKALEILHGAKFAHRNLHPTHVLKDVGERICLADFDSSVHFDENKNVVLESEGTWEASEVLQKMKESPPVTFTEDELFRADLQALGRLLHYMVTGGKDAYSSPADVACNRPSLEEELLSAEARHLIEWLLAPAAERATISDVKQHPFLWKPAEKIGFLHKVANEEDVRTRKEDTPITLRLNDKVDEQKTFYTWTEKIDEEVLNCMIMGAQKKPQKNSKTKFKNTPCDLLRLIRNLTEHLGEKSKEIQEKVGTPEEYFLGMFPDFTLWVYNALRSTEWERRFLKD
uniref:2-5A-dependent ribonuclease n=1 Tax=Callorhinchus milii TaxID=7868 RepID=V9K7E5_CALMI